MFPISSDSFSPFSLGQELRPDQQNNSYLSELLSGVDLNDRPSTAITLTGKDRERFKRYVLHSYQLNKSKHIPLHDKFRRYRDIYEMVTRYSDDGETVLYTSPGSANKVVGIAAHIIEGIEQPELFTASPMHGVESVDEVSEVAKLKGRYFNREIELGGSREIVSHDMPKEAVLMGTAFSPLVLGSVPIDGEYFWQFSDTVPVEDVVIDRVTARQLWQTNIFWCKRHIMNDLLVLGDQGIIDSYEAEKIYLKSHSFQPSYYEMAQGIMPSNVVAYEDDNADVELVYGYYRFRAEGDRKSEYYFTIFEPNMMVLLAAMPSPTKEIADMPPMFVTRIGKYPGRFYGRGIIERLLPIQEMKDQELNNYRAVSDLIASPPFQYRMNSPFGQAFEKKGGRLRLMAGLGIPTFREPKTGDVNTIPYDGKPNLFFANMGMLDGFEEDATYTDAFLGQGAKDTTLGAFNYSVNKGNIKVRLDYSDFVYDMLNNAKLFDSACLFKIKHNGVVEIHRGGDLLAYEDIPLHDFDNELTMMLLQYLDNGFTNGNEVVKALDMFGQRMLMGRIPGAKRNDIVITLKGTKIVADKLGELSKLLQLLPIEESLQQLASQSSYTNHRLRGILEAADIRDIDKRLPPDPNRNADPTTVFQMLQPFMDYSRSLSTV